MRVRVRTDWGGRSEFFAWTSIVRWFLFDVIDDEDGHGTLLLFQFQPKLPADRVEDRESAVGVGGAVVGGGGGGLYLVGGAEAEGKVPGAGDVGGVENMVVDVAGGEILKLIANLRKSHVLAGDKAVEDAAGVARILAV